MSENRWGAMTAEKAEATVRKSVTVDVSRERAFAVFTEGFDTWWIRSHHIGAAEMELAIIEPREDGRWYEKGVDGSECTWGYVITWQPPERLVLAWQINSQWQYDPSLVTEVEVTFAAEAAGRTRVDLQHHHIERMGEAASRMRAVFESAEGWSGLLRHFADQAGASHAEGDPQPPEFPRANRPA